ncbi:hypothetical protein GCM10023075_80010 [Streptosporangium album]
MLGRQPTQDVVGVVPGAVVIHRLSCHGRLLGVHRGGSWLRPVYAGQRGLVRAVDYHELSSIHLYPGLGAKVAALASPEAVITEVLLPPLNDHTFRWR